MGEEPAEDDTMTAGIAFMMADRSGQFIDDDEIEPARPPRPRGSETPRDTLPEPELPASFYQLLERLLALPEIGSVSFRGDPDFEFLRLACAERMRRHPDIEGVATDKGFAVNVLDVTSEWIARLRPIKYRDDDEPSLPGWLYWIQFWEEGLGMCRDFLVEMAPPIGLPLSEMPEERMTWKAIISFLEPELAREGYHWHHHADGFCFGGRDNEERIRQVAEKWSAQTGVR